MKKLLATAAASAAALGFAALPAGAQPEQNGLVNVNITDVNVQVPISVALNVCDVSVAALVDTFNDAPAECSTEGGSIALAPFETGDPNSPRQQGLVNLNLDDINAQIPIGILANICDVDVAVLVSSFLDDAPTCNTTGVSFADAT